LSFSAKNGYPLSALAFKIMNDPYTGQLTFFRIYSGFSVQETRSLIHEGKEERIGRLLKMHANKREEIQEVSAGDIFAAWSEVYDNGRHHLQRETTDRTRIDHFP